MKFMKDTGRIPTTALLLLVSLCAGRSLATAAEDKVGAKPSPLVGHEAPELDVAAWVNGEPTSLTSLRGKPVVLAFWDHTDKACGELVSVLNNIAREHASAGVAVVSVHSSGIDINALRLFILDNSVAFRVAVDKAAHDDRYRGTTFRKYGVRSIPSVFIISIESRVRYQDIPVRAVADALRNLLARGEVRTEPGGEETTAPHRQVSDPSVRQCADNLKQIGLGLKIFAHEHGGKFPIIDDRRGSLTMDARDISPEYIADPNVFKCPNSAYSWTGSPNTADYVTDQSYFYLGWVVTTEQEGVALLDAYESLDLEKRDEDLPLDPSRTSGPQRLYRIREGIERFWITDISDPQAGAEAQARIPVMWERPGNHVPDGGNVLYMDGHVEYVEYPGTFPMTEKFMTRLIQLSATKDTKVEAGRSRRHPAEPYKQESVPETRPVNVQAEPSSTGEDTIRSCFQSALLSFWQSGMEFTVDSKIAYNKPLIVEEPRHKELMPGEVVHYTITAYRQRGTRFLYNADHRYWWENDSVIEMCAYDGDVVRTLTYRPGRRKDGIIGPNPRVIEGVLHYKTDTGGFLRGCLVGNDLLAMLRNKNTRVSVLPDKSDIAGRSCFVFEIEDERSVNKVWVDPLRGYNYLRWDCCNKAKKDSEIDVGIREVSDIELQRFDGRWFPVAGKLHHIRSLAFGERNTTDQVHDWTQSVRLENVILGKIYTAEDFTIQFPEGTSVYDQRGAGKGAR